ncbi:MAG: hypothetical protein ACUVTD_08175 [Nitrososphaerales archaeon]
MEQLTERQKLAFGEEWGKMTDEIRVTLRELRNEIFKNLDDKERELGSLLAVYHGRLLRRLEEVI